MRRAGSCSARTFASADLPTRMGPSTTMRRGGLKLGLDSFTPRDYSRGVNAYPQLPEQLNASVRVGRYRGYQDFAITAIIRASESTSRVSITSAGECKYRNGQPSAMSTDP